MERITQADRLWSKAPLGWPISLTAGHQLPAVIPEEVVLQTCDGARFWRRAWPDCATLIESRLAPGTRRANYEGEYYSRSEMGRQDYASSDLERAHAQGAGTGFEAKFGISYAPREVNQELQNIGIEEFLRTIEINVPSDITFRLLTEIRRHPGSLRLAQVLYRLDAFYKGSGRLVFVTGIRVSNSVTEAVATIATDLTEVNTEAFRILPINDLPSSLLLRRVELMMRRRKNNVR
jgi:hypothetical protein